MDPDEDPDDSRPLRDLLAVFGRPCAGCAGDCPAHDVVRSIALGFKDAPRCLPCLAQGLSRDAGELRDQLADYVQRRECFRRAWSEADRLAGAQPVTNPLPTGPVATNPSAADESGEFWDAGPMACGELVLALRLRLNNLPPGTVLTVRATDPAAPEDIPAWCRLTRHAILSADHPSYRIRRRED
jgi:tRNA 2-thiouridine synthesizing protein A